MRLWTFRREWNPQSDPTFTVTETRVWYRFISAWQSDPHRTPVAHTFERGRTGGLIKL